MDHSLAFILAVLALMLVPWALAERVERAETRSVPQTLRERERRHHFRIISGDSLRQPMIAHSYGDRLLAYAIDGHLRSLDLTS